MPYKPENIINLSSVETIFLVDSVSSRASPSPPGEGVARFELTFLGLGEVSRCFLVHGTQTERKGGGGNAMYRSTKRQFCETEREGRTREGCTGRREGERERGVNGEEHEQEHV